MDRRSQTLHVRFGTISAKSHDWGFVCCWFRAHFICFDFRGRGFGGVNIGARCILAKEEIGKWVTLACCLRQDLIRWITPSLKSLWTGPLKNMPFQESSLFATKMRFF